jgi:hypothetical protein
MHSTGLPGHEWDQTLQEYCSGARSQPVWAVGELDYGENSYLMSEITNIVYVKIKSAKEILSSLKTGKNYARWNPNNSKWALDMPSFYVQSGDNSAICGETISYLAQPKIFIKLSTSDNKQHPVNIRIIRNGKLHTTLEAFAPNTIIYEDNAPLDQKLNYYRAFIDDPANNHLATNPVFLSKYISKK